MIPNGEGWNHITVKQLPALLRGITSNHGDFFCLTCFYYFATENNCESHKKLYENKEFCNVVMSSEDPEILKFNQYKKIDKVPFAIYADLECWIMDVKIILKIHLQQK